MRIALTILFYSLCQSLFASTYYVANVGSDSNSGDISNPFATIAKANLVAVSGDFIYLKRGDTWHEKVYPVSGVTYDAYGTGNKPLITGFQVVTGFTNVGNVWTASINAPSKLNTVLFNGKLVAKARYPNSTYLTFTARTDTSVTGTLTGTPNYTGAKIVERNSHWTLETRTIKSQSGGTLYFDSIPFHNGGGNGYFIQDASYLIDSIGEWFYDTTAKTLSIYSLTEPTVSVSTIDTLIYLNHKSNISINNISFTGSNFGAIISDTSNHIVISNCTFKDNGFNAVYGRKSTAISVTNDSIINSLNGAVVLTNDNFNKLDADQCDTATVMGNYIKNVGHLEGMGGSGEGRYIGVWMTGNAFNISNNIVDSTGYIGVYWNGLNGLIKNNLITHFCFVKDDGAGIYTTIDHYPVTTAGTRIISNIIKDGLSSPQGTGGGNNTFGIYLDVKAANVIIDSNMVTDVGYAGLFFHQPNAITFRHNTLYNCGQYDVVYSQLLTQAQNHVVTNNIIYKDNTDFPLFYIGWPGKSIFGIQDSNYYSNSLDQNKIVMTGGINYSLPNWVTFSGADSNSVSVPSGILTDTAILKYNSTNSTQTFRLPGVFVDFFGNTYDTKITLAPFTSAVLFPKFYYNGILETKFFKVTHE